MITGLFEDTFIRTALAAHSPRQLDCARWPRRTESRETISKALLLMQRLQQKPSTKATASTRN